MAITVQPVNESLFDDVQTIFGAKGQAARCQCQGYRMGWYAQHSDNVPGRRELLRDQVIEGHGLVAHLDGEPVGWCSVAPRSDYTYLRQTTWKGRNEDKDDAGIWAVTCFVTRAGFRHQGVSRALAAGTIDLARDHGARAVEAYPMKPPRARRSPGARCTSGRSARSSPPGSGSCTCRRCGGRSCATTTRREPCRPSGHAFTMLLLPRLDSNQ